MRRRMTRAAVRYLIRMIAFAAIGSVPPAVASSDQLLVNVPEPFEVSGQIFPAGPVTVQHVGEATPATTIDQVRIGNEYVGVLIADRSRTQGQDLLSPSLVFERAVRGHLVLVGFTTGDGPAGRLYLYRRHRLDAAGEHVVLIASQ